MQRFGSCGGHARGAQNRGFLGKVSNSEARVCARTVVCGCMKQPNHALQADKGGLSRHLRAHMARQLAFAAERGR